jgi:hypothetical protein
MKDGLIADLKGLLKGKLSREDFRRNLARHPRHISDLIVGNIDHFLDDGDIRARDPKYKKMQERELQKLISLLEGNGSEEKIRKISFLAPTAD